jgi:uncharacterized membrane protein
MVVLLLIGFSPSIDKIGLSYSTPLIWVFSTHLGMSVVLGGRVYLKDPNWTTKAQSNVRPLLIIGVLNSILWLVQIYAYEIFYVSYVQAIKRVSILLSIVAGYFFFDETHIKNRLLGGTIILSGVICIILVA